MLVIILAASQATAQVNVETLRRDEDQEGFSGSIGLDLSTRTGNVELVMFGIGGRMDYVGDNVTTFLVGSGDFGWQGEERFSNESLLHLRQVYRRGSRFRPEAFVQVNHDRSRLLTFRGLVGGGLRIGVYRGAAVRFWWGSDYMFEHERLNLGSNAVHPSRPSVHRWSNYLTLKARFGEQTVLAWAAYIHPRVDDVDDVRILSEARLVVELSHPVSLVVSHHLRYDSRPPEGTVSLDTAGKSGIAVEF